jgi:hypothetical protein
MAQRRDLIPIAVRFAVRDAVGGWGIYTVAEIGELFQAEGFAPVARDQFVPSSGGQRRQEAERYQAAIDFSDPSEVDRYLRVVARILEDHDTVDGRVTSDKLLKALGRAGIKLNARGRLVLPTRASVSAALASTSSEGVRLQLERLQRLDATPEELVGASKELVEAAAKHVLTELGETIGPAEDLTALSKRALARLSLDPKGIAPTIRGAEIMTRLLAGFAQVAGGLAELRNLGYGTGHGQSGRITGIKARHAELAARAAIAYATFLLETLEDPDAPWH